MSYVKPTLQSKYHVTLKTTKTKIEKKNKKQK